MKEETISESLKKYLSDIGKYESLIQDPTKTEKEYNRYANLLNQANINITRVQWLRQEREKKLGEVKDLKENIIKLEIELNNLQEMKDQANYFKGTKYPRF